MVNTKLFLSGTTILAAAALILGATFAFFSDTETSQNNTLVGGALDLKIDNTSYLNGVLNQDTTWELDDLTDQLFFDFTDVKPSDVGEDTISLHTENDSWVCADFTLTENNDNTCTANETPDDLSCTEPNGNLFDGELAQNIEFAFWTDDGDNVLETDEEIIASGSAEEVLDGEITLADSQTNNLGGADGDPMTGGEDHFIAKAWCFGDLSLNPVTAGQGISPTVDGGVSCDGSLLDNATQSDRLLADIQFTAVQSRNNPDFVCGEPSPSVTPTPTPDPGERFVDSVTSVVGTFGHCCGSLSSDPSVAAALITGAPDSPPDTDFIQISTGSAVTARFDNNKAINGPGNDIRIWIFDTLFPATAKIEVSADPACAAGFVNAGNFPDTSNAEIDLTALGLSEARCVKLTDLGGPDTTFPTLGFDLDAIEAINSVAFP